MSGKEMVGAIEIRKRVETMENHNSNYRFYLFIKKYFSHIER